MRRHSHRRKLPQVARILFGWATMVSLLFLPSCMPEGTYADGAGRSGSGTDPAGECVGPLGAPADPSELPACCQDLGGKAHCVANVPAEFQSLVSACEGGGFCVPDVFIETGGVHTPPKCVSLGDAEGRCLSVCVPRVAEYKDILPQDKCAPDERCVPCVSPLDNKPTGVCDVVGECVDEGGGGTGETGGTSGPDPANGDDPNTCIYDGPEPVVDPSGLPACADDAHCLDPALVPQEFRSRLAACSDGVKLCVPDTFLETGGKFDPPTCRSIHDAEGRCLSRALPEVKAQEAFLPQSTCAASERCVPCFNPIDGSNTGACALSCDTGPMEPARPLPACCEGRGKCVPTALISEKQAENLAERECEDVQDDAYLCVPTEMLSPTFKPRTCTAQSLLLGNYSGVCLSECLSFGIQGLALARGNCADDYKCVPCTQNGQPTGAPGCP